MQVKPGDFFYTHQATDEEYVPAGYYVYKILVVDQEFKTLHVRGYKPLDKIPTKEDISSLVIKIGHFPVAADGFLEGAVYLDNRPVQEDELTGYHYYLNPPSMDDFDD